MSVPHGNVKKKPIAPTGPYAPPKPSEAEDERPEPMAVARDKQTTNDAFMPTTAPMEQATRPRDENRAREAPRGYSEPDVMGFRHPDEDEPGGAPVHRNKAAKDLEETDEDVG